MARQKSPEETNQATGGAQDQFLFKKISGKHWVRTKNGLKRVTSVVATLDSIYGKDPTWQVVKRL